MVVSGICLLASLWLTPHIATGADLSPSAFVIALVAFLCVPARQGPDPANAGQRYRPFISGQVAVGVASLVVGRFFLGWSWSSFLFLPIWVAFCAATIVPDALRYDLPRLFTRMGMQVPAWCRKDYFADLLRRRIAQGDDTALSGALLVAGVTELMAELVPGLGFNRMLTIGLALGWLIIDRSPIARWQTAATPGSRAWGFGLRLAIWTILSAAALWLFGGFTSRSIGMLLIPALTSMAFFGASHRHKVAGGSENAARVTLAVVTVLLIRPFATSLMLGGPDAGWYHNVLGDFIAQSRAGIFPIFVGQSEFLFNGGILPVRFAPLFQHYGLVLDWLTLQSLSPLALQNGIIIACFAATTVTTYAMASTLLPGQAWTSAAISAIFLSCPGLLAIVYREDLLMTWAALPWLPLAFLGCAQACRQPDTRPLLLTSLALAMTWWAHAPVALWTTLVIALVVIAKLASIGIARWPWRPLLAGVACFLTVALYPFVSVLSVSKETAATGLGFVAADPGNLVYFIKECFPAILVPLPFKDRSLADFQLGWSLIVILVLCGVVLLLRKERKPYLWVIFLAAIMLQGLLLPMGNLTAMLWEWVPGVVRSITGTWVMQRFYVIIALCIACLACILLAQPRTTGSQPSKWRLLALALASLWSVYAALPLQTEKEQRRRDNEAEQMRPENHALTRYAYALFARQPAYFSHGHMDPYLEQRFLSQQDREWVGGNPNALLTDKPAGRILHAGNLTARHAASSDPWEIAPTFLLEPNKRYVLELHFSHPTVSGVLLVTGQGIHRIYALPLHGERLAFGSGPESSPLLPLFTSSRTPVDVRLRFVAQPETAISLREFGSYRFTEIDPQSLPVRVTSWIPYQAEVTAPADTWLETPRMYQRGYRAFVNGTELAPVASPEGLVAVPVPAGHSSVRLQYDAPGRLRISFWISLAAMVVFSVFLAAARTRPGQEAA